MFFCVECRLWVRSPRGRLLSSYLPPNAVQCRLEFGPRGGVLLELFRLNAPCQAGGFLALEGRREETLCGKLEELPLRHRKLQVPNFDIVNATVNWDRFTIRLFHIHWY